MLLQSVKIVVLCALLSAAIFAQTGANGAATAPEAPKATGKATAAPDPLALTEGEKASLQGFLAEEGKLQTSQAAVLKALVEAAADDTEKLARIALQIRDVLKSRQELEGRVLGWLAVPRARAQCLDCNLDVQAGRLVKPTPAANANAKLPIP